MKKYIGSIIALVLGILLTLTGLSDKSKFDYIIFGVDILLGTIAYMLAKSRIYNKLKNNKKSIIIEVICIIIVIYSIVGQNNLKYHIAHQPIGNIIIPVWILLSYTIINLIGRKRNNKTDND